MRARKIEVDAADFCTDVDGEWINLDAQRGGTGEKVVSSGSGGHDACF